MICSGEGCDRDVKRRGMCDKHYVRWLRSHGGKVPAPAERVRAVSFGAGVQSTALLVLAAQKEIDYDLFLFANTGDDSEHPDTLQYLREIAVPYAAEHGIELVELRRVWGRGDRAGQVETLRSRLARGQNAIPTRTRRDGPPMNRTCTAEFKVAVVNKEIRRRGASAKYPALVALGISVDEMERAKPGIDRRSPATDRTYPLLDLGLTREMCRSVIADAGLPIPPKSACYFCPFTPDASWRRLHDTRPDLFADAQQIEVDLSATYGQPVFLTRHGVPLGDAVDLSQMSLDGLDGCDSGWCMT